MNLWEIWMTRKSKIFGIKTRGSKKGQMVEIVGERGDSYITVDDEGWEFKGLMALKMHKEAVLYCDISYETRCFFVSKSVIDVSIFDTKLGSLW